MRLFFINALFGLGYLAAPALAEDFSYTLGGIFDIGVLNTTALTHPDLVGGEDWGNSIRSRVYKEINGVTYSLLAMEGFRFGENAANNSHTFVKELSVSTSTKEWGKIKAGRMENPVFLALGNGTLDPFLWGRNNEPLLTDDGARLTGTSYTTPLFLGAWSLDAEHGKQYKTDAEQTIFTLNYNKENIAALLSSSSVENQDAITGGGRMLFDWGSLIGAVQHKETYNAFSAGFIKLRDNKKGEIEGSVSWLTNKQKQIIVGATQNLDDKGRWVVYTSVSHTLYPNIQSSTAIIFGIRWACLPCIDKH